MPQAYPANHMYIATYGVLPIISDPNEPEGDLHKIIYQHSYPTPDPNIDGTMFYGWEVHALNVINQLDTDFNGPCTMTMSGGGRFITHTSGGPVDYVTVNFSAGIALFGMGYTYKYLPAIDDVENLANTYTVVFNGLGPTESSASFKFIKNPCYTDLTIRACAGSEALNEVNIDLSQTVFIEYEICVNSKSDISYEGCASWPVISTAQVQVNNIPDFLIYTGSKVFTFDYKGKANLGLFTFAVKKEYLADKNFVLDDALASHSTGEFYVVSNSGFPGKGIYQAGPITINFLNNENKSKTFETPPRYGRPARLEDINRLGESGTFKGSAIVGSGPELYEGSISNNTQQQQLVAGLLSSCGINQSITNQSIQSITNNSVEPISSNFSSAGAFYYPLDLDDSPTIYYLPKHHCSVHGSLTKPYNVLASRAFENPKVLSRFLSAECIAVYELLDIMLCAPNKYEFMNNRPEQLIGSTEGRDKINCEWPLTGELGIHSYVASIAPVVIKNYESGYDREICSFPCEGFFPACSVPSLVDNGHYSSSYSGASYHTATGEETPIEMTHVKLPCTLARTFDLASGESRLTVAVAITNFGFSPVFKEDQEWWVDGQLYSYVFGSVDPVTGKRTQFCPYTSRTSESLISRTIYPDPASFGHSYVAYNGRKFSYGVLRSDRFAFQVASPDAFSNTYEPLGGYVWTLNTHFNMHFCSVQKTSKEPVPSYTYFEIPAAYVDTTYTADPNNLMEHDADKIGDSGYMNLKGKVINYPYGYEKRARVKDLNNLEKGCIQLDEGYWNGREFHSRDQVYCVVPMIEPAGCTNIVADGAPGAGSSRLTTNDIDSTDTIKAYAASVKNTKTSGPLRVKEQLF